MLHIKVPANQHVLTRTRSVVGLSGSVCDILMISEYVLIFRHRQSCVLRAHRLIMSCVAWPVDLLFSLKYTRYLLNYYLADVIGEICSRVTF